MKNYNFRVIIAEDEQLIAKNISKNITRANSAFEVVYIAKDGEEALKLTRTLLPDVVFSDIKMPVMDGLRLIAAINDEFPTIKTVIISGYDDFELVRTALQHHASDYLLKPVNLKDLENTLVKLERGLLAEKKEFFAIRKTLALEKVESLKAYLKKNYGQPVNLAKIASQFNFSNSYLTKIFKEHTGVSPGKYLKKYRINVAKKLLIDSNLSANEISDKCGFIDQFHFSKTFKSEAGISPIQFRNQARQKMPDIHNE